MKGAWMTLHLFSTATVFRLVRQWMGLMTSQLQIPRTTSILWAFVVPKLILWFAAAGQSAQTSLKNIVQYKIVWRFPAYHQMISNGAVPSTFPIHFLIFWLQFFHVSSLFFPYFWIFKITIGMKLFNDVAEGICTKDLGVGSEDSTNWATTTAPHFFYLFLNHFFQWVSNYFSLFFSL